MDEQVLPVSDATNVSIEVRGEGRKRDPIIARCAASIIAYDKMAAIQRKAVVEMARNPVWTWQGALFAVSEDRYEEPRA